MAQVLAHAPSGQLPEELQWSMRMLLPRDSSTLGAFASTATAQVRLWWASAAAYGSALSCVNTRVFCLESKLLRGCCLCIVEVHASAVLGVVCA